MTKLTSPSPLAGEGWTGEGPRVVGVVDVGKTNAKVVLISGESGAELASRIAPTEVRQDGLYPHLDVARLWGFIRGAIAELSTEHRIEALAVTAHGSAGAFLSDSGEDADGLALPILDYEFAGPDELAEAYDAVRPRFDETLSPRLPAGLNLGAQIFWQQKRFPEAVQRSLAYVNYPQYWTWRLAGVAATEACSMGAHSDLWNPRRLAWSSLVERMNWQGLFAPLSSAFDVLGRVKPELACELGLMRETPAVCGIHDSSAALLPHVIAREAPFTVVSTGTWTILFAVGGDLDRLDPKRDTLANVTAFGEPLPCARFMGGRDFQVLAGRNAPEATPADVGRVLEDQVMATPSFVPGVGPFPDRCGGWSHPPETLTPGERSAAASLYLALMTAEAMSCTDARGTTLVEGPFAANHIVCSALAAITGRAVLPSSGGSGTSRGAACLFFPEQGFPAAADRPAEPLAHPALAAYVQRWRDLARGA